MLTRSSSGDLLISVDGRPVRATAGDSVAVALLAAGMPATRTTAISGTSRGPYCMMGACFECLAVIDGLPGVQTCMTEVRDGMRVESQHGAKALFAQEPAGMRTDGRAPNGAGYTGPSPAAES